MFVFAKSNLSSSYEYILLYVNKLRKSHNFCLCGKRYRYIYVPDVIFIVKYLSYFHTYRYNWLCTSAIIITTNKFRYFYCVDEMNTAGVEVHLNSNRSYVEAFTYGSACETFNKFWYLLGANLFEMNCLAEKEMYGLVRCILIFRRMLSWCLEEIVDDQTRKDLQKKT